MRHQIKIIHLSDMHLLIDEQGDSLPFEEAHATIRGAYAMRAMGLAPGFVSDLIPGFNPHSPDALTALLRTVDRIVDRSHCPVFIAQTGDVSAHGARIVDGAITLPAMTWWGRQTQRWIDHGVMAVFNLFGNHDVWPGTLPGLRPLLAPRVEYSLRNVSALGFDQLFPRVEAVTIHGAINLHVGLLDTVHTGTLANTLAVGAVLPDAMLARRDGVYPLTRRREPLSELVRAFAEARVEPGAPTLRLALLHHPPHFFGASSAWAHLTEGALLNARDVAEALDHAGCHLVLAGHRHICDPPVAGRDDEAAGAQPPLPAHLRQLATATPTQCAEKGGPAPGFSVYTIDVDPGHFSVKRSVFRFDESIVGDAVMFRPHDEETLHRRLPLDRSPHREGAV